MSYSRWGPNSFFYIYASYQDRLCIVDHAELTQEEIKKETPIKIAEQILEAIHLSKNKYDRMPSKEDEEILIFALDHFSKRDLADDMNFLF